MSTIRPQIEEVDISTIKTNPSNPRIIKDEKFKKLVESIRSFPDMLHIRPIVVNENNEVLGGNMRLKALRHLKYDKVPVIRANKLTEAQKKEFIIKDNVGFGEWDWDVLANEWDENKLNAWGLDCFTTKEVEENEDVELESENQYYLNVTCADENECQRLYDKFIKDGLNVKIIT